MYPEDAATFSNRAAAHFSLKEYARTIEDATKAIQMKPDYLKAYYRRGKAYKAVNKLEYAIKDFQFILEVEPHNKEAMNDLKAARNQQEGKKTT